VASRFLNEEGIATIKVNNVILEKWKKTFR